MLLVFSFLSLIVAITLIFIFTKKYSRYGLFFIPTILLLLSIIDTIIPSILWNIYGYESKAIWLEPITNSQILYGLLYYNLFYILMVLSIIFFSYGKKINLQFSFDNRFKRIEKRLLYLIIFTGFMFTLSILNEITSYGGLTEWLFNKFTIRFRPYVDTSSNILDMIYALPWRAMFNLFVFTGFFLRFKLNKLKLYGIILPVIAILFSITTSFRGSILMLLLGFLYLEYMRIYIHKSSFYKSSFGVGRETIFKFKYYLFGILSISAFLLYGVMRDSYVSDILEYDSQPKSSAIYMVVSQGSSLQGVSTIMRRYGEDLDYLLGKTYIDMLLLPIPRSIYTSKPEWYGIDDITKNMGWPESTQSAVSMPGEAYANFGWFGLSIALIYGFIFGSFIKLINKKGGLYMLLYPTIIIPILFVTNWMAFTGFMNMMVNLFFTIVCLSLLIIKFHTRKRVIL